jgi:HlyD family secretion protein
MLPGVVASDSEPPSTSEVVQAMKFPVKTAVAILLLGAGGYVAYSPVRAWWKARHKPSYREAAVARGDITSSVNATGTVQPVLRVQVGSVVSGPIRSPKGAFESLSASTTGTRITAHYEAATGVLTLSGQDSVANYQRVLRTVTYSNTSQAPNTTPRTLTFVASDGTRDGNIGTATVTILAQNSRPVADREAGGSANLSGANSEPMPDPLTPGPRPLRGARRNRGEGRTSGDRQLAAVGVENGDLLPAGAETATLSAAPRDVAVLKRSAGGGSSGGRANLLPTSAGGGQVVPVADDKAPLLDLDADDSSGRSGADFATTFTQGGKPVPVADRDAVLSDADNTDLARLTITITNVLDDGKLAYYNQEVKKGDLLAEIDPRIYEAAVARDQATLRTRLADVDRVEALVKQAEAEERRAKDLKQMEEQYRAQTGVKEVKFISDTELDQIKANRASLEAQLKVSLAAVEQARGNLENSVVNLDYTKITSPVDGIVIDRKIDEGQTLAAQFQAPELFVVAPNMREKMHVIASVDEADMGMIRKAEREKRPVHFTVDAYPDDLFEGTIFQVRMNPTTVQNVVTYPVVVEVSNPELKLLPGMTANLSFETDKLQKVLEIPNAALRFYPLKPEEVRPEDRKLLEGTGQETPGDEGNVVEGQRPAKDRALANRKRNRRHVWIREGEYLRAVEVVTGLSDYKWTQLVSGDLKEGDKLVTGVAPPGS